MTLQAWIDPAEWRERVRSAAAAGLPVDVSGLAPNRPIPPPRVLEAPAARVEAVGGFCIGGQPVVPGQVYTVSAGDAERLIALGKAKRV